MSIIEKNILKKLNSSFEPVYLKVINESHMHSGPINAETHFKLIIVSAVFMNKNKIERHRMVYELLSHELSEYIHALAIHTYTQTEWKQAPLIANSPLCSNKKS